MAKFLHSILFPDQAILADEVRSIDLPVNPLSVIYLVLRPLNDTGTLANYPRYRDVCKAFNRLTVSYRGEAIHGYRGEDLASLNWLRWGLEPWQANADNVDNERRAVVLPLIMGRYPWDRQSCFPATRRGELTLEWDLDIADTGYDGMRVSVETLELLDAKPDEYEKRTTISQTFAATGDNDIELPMGNNCRGILGFGTTGFGGASPAPTLGRMKVLLDNVEYGYANTDFEVAYMFSSLWGRQPNMGQHGHTVNAAGAGVEETTSVFDVQDDHLNYVFLDYDPDGKDTFDIPTKGANSFKLRVTAETADACRIIPIETVKLSS